MNTQQDLSITVPIAAEFRTLADQIAATQETEEKRSLVYWNTIAALAVSEYLQWQGYEVRGHDLVERVLSEDIWIAGVGRIGGLRVLQEGTVFELSEEGQQGRVGSIVLTCEERQVRLWGFLPLFDPEDLPVEVEWSEVWSLDTMVEYFTRLERGSQEPQLQALEPDEVERLRLVALLERIYREESRNRWGIRAAQVLLEEGQALALSREAKLPKDLTERQGLAEQMMERLAEVWNEGDGLMV